MSDLEKLLNGRSILDLTGDEAALAVEMLANLVNKKPIEEFTDTEFQALVEELTECLMINLNTNSPKEALEWIENHPANGWGWRLVSIIDLQLHGIDIWDSLSAEDSQTVAEAIVHYLEEQIWLTN
jgi:hypothetical protein